jgi:intracellular multiplication protein IcmB
MLNSNADQFCDLGGYDAHANNAVFFAHDGSDISLIRIDGVRTLLSEPEFIDRMLNVLSIELAQLLKTPGHNLVLSYEKSNNVAEEIDRHLAQQRNNATLKELKVDAILGEVRDILLHKAISEKITLAAITRPIAGLARDITEQKRQNDEAVALLPEMVRAMSPHLELKGLSPVHRAFVSAIMSTMERCGIIAAIIQPGEDGARPDLAEVRKGIFHHDTPTDWVPYEAGPVSLPPIKLKRSGDVSDLFAPPLAQQIISSAPIVSSDMRSVSWGPRTFAVAQVQRYPKNLRSFNRLIDLLAAAKMPYRVSISMEALVGADKAAMQMRQIFSQFVGFISPRSKIINENLKNVIAALGNDSEAVVRTNLLAVTWIEPGEAKEILANRASQLVAGIKGWGECMVTDTPASPVRAVAETIAGMNATSQSWRGTVAPLSSLSVILPLHRTAQIFGSGETLFTSPEGKIMPHKAFSADLPAYLTLISAGTGSGKSVFANRMNFELAAYRPGKELPFMMVADVGVSSSGCMNLLKALLPEGRKGEVTYIRLKNTADYAVNPFDISLGTRVPLERERMFIQNFLMTAIPMQYEMLSQLISRIIQRVFDLKSDISIDSRPNKWQAGIDQDLNTAITKSGIKVTDRTSYWTIVDEFIKRGDHAMAIRAQQYAVPRMKDLAQVISEPQMKSDFPADALETLKRYLESIEATFPIFTQHTRLDTGGARIMAVDLQDVVMKNVASDDQKRKNTLFYLITRQIFMTKIAGDVDDLPQFRFPEQPDTKAAYISYWEKVFRTIAETPKRIMLDEYHVTGSIPTINDMVDYDARTGRKWNLEVVLVSQKLTDFKGLTSQATIIVILNSDNQESRDQLKAEMGANEAIDRALQKYVNGPDKADPTKGANALMMIKGRNEERRWTIINNSLGVMMLWALTTKPGDRALRDEIYKRVGMERGLVILGRRFPEATANERWEAVASKQGRDDDSIASLLADEVMVFASSDVTGLQRLGLQ